MRLFSFTETTAFAGGGQGTQRGQRRSSDNARGSSVAPRSTLGARRAIDAGRARLVARLKRRCR
jgi:hypothetical protein